MSLSSSDLYQHRADVLRGAPSAGGAKRRHRRMPNGDEDFAYERQHVEPRQLHILQQAGLGVRRDQHRLTLAGKRFDVRASTRPFFSGAALMEGDRG